MKSALLALLEQAVDHLKQQYIIPAEHTAHLHLERTKDKSHGDWATNLAMTLAKPAKSNPRQMATHIVDYLQTQNNATIERMDIAGPGFINFFVTTSDKSQIVATVLQQGETFGQLTPQKPLKILLEYVSANPTGPLHVGHGRGAAYGAALASLLKKAGHEVTQEYYVNDAGRQMDILATSTYLRYLQLCQHTTDATLQLDQVAFPSNGYQGDYVKDIAQNCLNDQGSQWVHPWPMLMENVIADETTDAQGHTHGDKEKHIDGLIANSKTLLGDNGYRIFFQAALDAILADIQQDLAAFNVHIDHWFSEKSLMNDDQGHNAVQSAVELLQNQGWIESRQGTLWFQSEKLGDEKDRVVVRDNGQPTYFASDIAYHWQKIQRGYDQLIDIWGADHHGYIARVKAAMQALKLDPEQLKILLVQFANLYRDGKKLAMSTRSGQFITLRDLRDEVGTDAARYFYVARKCEQHMDFDLDLAKSQHNDNPVYYAQYAHARICTVLRKGEAKGLDCTISTDHLDLLSTTAESDLLNALSDYPDVIARAARDYEPHQIANYIQQLAQRFHTYYNQHDFLVEDHALRQARLALIHAIRFVLADALALLGISAPEQM